MTFPAQQEAPDNFTSRHAEKARQLATKTLPETFLLSIAELEDYITRIPAELRCQGVGAAPRIVLNEYRHACRSELQKREAKP